MGNRLLRILVDLAQGCIFNCLSVTILNWLSFRTSCVDCGAWLDSLFLYSVLEAVVSPLDDGNGARPRAWLKIACINYQPSGRPTGTRFP